MCVYYAIIDICIYYIELKNKNILHMYLYNTGFFFSKFSICILMKN